MKILAILALLVSTFGTQAAVLRAVKHGPDVYILANSTGRPFRLEFSSDGRKWIMVDRSPNFLLVKATPWFRGHYPAAFWRAVDENSDYRPVISYK